MSDVATTLGAPTLGVVGASGVIGREVARLAVAYGCRVIGVCRRGVPPNDEPWTAGVEWIAGDVRTDSLAELLGACDAVVDCCSAEVRGSLRGNRQRVVEVGCAAEARIGASMPPNVIHLRVPPLDPRAELGEILPSSKGIATSHAAMAALRVAIEEDHAGIVEPSVVAHLGDAMFLQ